MPAILITLAALAAAGLLGALGLASGLLKALLLFLGIGIAWNVLRRYRR
jgi:hypothetical protein